MTQINANAKGLRDAFDAGQDPINVELDTGPISKSVSKAKGNGSCSCALFSWFHKFTLHFFQLHGFHVDSS